MKSVNQKREEGAKRDALWASLTPAEQMRELDRRLGKGVGATRQRARIQSIIDAAQASPVPQAAEVLPAVKAEREYRKKGKK